MDASLAFPSELHQTDRRLRQWKLTSLGLLSNLYFNVQLPSKTGAFTTLADGSVNQTLSDLVL